MAPNHVNALVSSRIDTMHDAISVDDLLDMVFAFDEKGVILGGNVAFHDVVGEWPDDAVRPFDALFRLANGMSLASLITRIEASEKGVSFDAMVMHHADGTKPVELRCRMSRSDPLGRCRIVATGRLQTSAAIMGGSPGEQKFRRLAEAAPVAIYQADPNGNISYVNQRWAERLGYAAKDLLGKGWQRYVVDAKVYEDDPPWIGFTPENSTRIRTNRFRTRTGEIIEFQTLNQAEFGPDGHLLGFVGVMFDVTEQAKALREYQQSEERFSAFASLSSIGIFRADAAGNLFFANAKWCEIAGIDMVQASGSGWLEAVHPDDREKVVAAWQRTITTREGQARFRFLHHDGSVRHVDAVSTAETAIAGHVHGYIGVVVDVTRDEEISAQLRQRERQLAILAANSRDPIFRLDRAGKCLYASPAAEEMLGLQADELRGASMIAPSHLDDLPALLQAFQELSSGARDRSKATFRARSPSPPFDYHWMEAQGALIRDAQGEPSEIIVSLRDVTAQKKLESELREAREQAERSARSKASFLANMSHEIRTPMNGVLGYADLLAMSELDDTQREQVELIRGSGRAMMKVLNDVLDLSKTEAGQTVIEERAIDIALLLQNTLKLALPMADSKGLKLAIDISPTVPAWIRADGARLRQIISNLLMNAVKFTAAGLVRLAAKVENATLVIQVQDTGRGIAPTRLEAIFESFAQESEAIHEEFGGTGLGLAISRSLALAMGGSLTVESEVGSGTVFALQIPLKSAKPPICQQQPKQIEQSPVAFEGRVLVAEDHPVNQALISAMLEKLGIEFDLVSDGQAACAAALEAINQGRGYKLVLMDIEMPVLGGVASVQTVRSAGVDATTLPVIALTAHAFPEDITAYREAGMQAHLEKPLRLETLAEMLRKWA